MVDFPTPPLPLATAMTCLTSSTRVPTAVPRGGPPVASARATTQAVCPGGALVALGLAMLCSVCTHRSPERKRRDEARICGTPGDQEADEQPRYREASPPQIIDTEPLSPCTAVQLLGF